MHECDFEHAARRGNGDGHRFKAYHAGAARHRAASRSNGNDLPLDFDTFATRNGSVSIGPPQSVVLVPGPVTVHQVAACEHCLRFFEDEKLAVQCTPLSAVALRNSVFEAISRPDRSVGYCRLLMELVPTVSWSDELSPKFCVWAGRGAEPAIPSWCYPQHYFRRGCDQLQHGAA